MLPRRIILASILVASMAATGCIKQVAKSLSEVQRLHAELTKKFGDEVYVNLSQTDKNVVVSVSFINSALNEKTPEERFKRAGEAATVVATNYPRIKDVGAIWVGFIRQKTRMLVFHYSQSLNFYAFDRTGQPLQPPRETTTSGVKLETVANYLREDDESNVFAYGIQLEGEPGKDGVTVMPYLRTKGDVNVKKGPRPKMVQFDFASYSSTPRFPQTVTFTFIADGKQVFKTTGTFQGNDAQFCYLPVSYPAFRQMIAAKSLTIKVGAKDYTLTPSQFGAVQKMGDYVAE